MSALWKDTVEFPHYPALATDLQVDVCVIGAGITGLSAAHELKKAGLRVALLEQNRVGHGMTGHTTAHLIKDRLRHPQHAELGEVPRGQGRIVTYEGEQVAAYRDEQGELHMGSAVCTHMAWLVHFNEAGPATRPLAKIEARKQTRR